MESSHLSPGAGLVPYRYSKTVHGGFGGAQMAMIKNGKIVVIGKPLVTEPARFVTVTQ